jgi:hypothetical protein
MPVIWGSLTGRQLHRPHSNDLILKQKLGANLTDRFFHLSLQRSDSGQVTLGAEVSIDPRLSLMRDASASHGDVRHAWDLEQQRANRGGERQGTQWTTRAHASELNAEDTGIFRFVHLHRATMCGQQSIDVSNRPLQSAILRRLRPSQAAILD